MRRITALVGLLLTAGTVHAADAPVLRGVVLSTAGTGQFVFEAAADGPGDIPLDVALDQVDDLLKSLVVDDPGGARATVGLPGREPLPQAFRTLPFGPDALRSPEALLGALVGEAARIPAEGYTGTILSVTPFDVALPNGGGTLTRHRLTLATPAGLASAVLEDAGAVEIVSDVLRRQIGGALAAVAAARVQDRRTLQVHLGAGGPRTVRLTFVVPAPVWKASYRLVLPDATAAGPLVQGFAVLENLSGRDWRGVDLVLTSGNPVLYHQALYDPVFTTRPDAPVDVPNRLTPKVDEGTQAEPSPPPPPAPAVAKLLARPARSAPPPPPSPPPPAEVAAGVAQVSFHLPAPVDAPSGQTLLLPIVDRVFPGRRVALFRFGEGGIHPVVALLVRNDTPGALPPGLATLYAATGADFVGDALMPAVQPGEERLLGFAADLPVTIDAQPSSESRIATVRAARGVLEVRRQDRAVTTYRISTPADAGRTVLIEQPRRRGWTLAEPAGLPHADTPTHHRITLDVPAGITRTLEVVLVRDRGERIVLADAEPDALAALSTDGQAPAGLKAALAQAAALRAEQDRRNAVQAALQDRRDRLVTDQERVRANLAALPAGDLQRRFMASLQGQEDQIAALDAQIAAAQKASDATKDALRDYLDKLTL